MKKIFTLCFIICCIFGTISAADKTVANLIAGMLSTQFTEEEITTVSNLKVSGKMDARDLRFISEKLIMLEYLDLEDIDIVTYTGLGGTEPEENRTYDANTIPFDFISKGSTNVKKPLIFVLPKSAKTIEDYAFSDSSLKEIIFPQNSQLENIYSSAFSGTKIESIKLPPTVKYLDMRSFQSCQKLKKVDLSETKIEELYNQAFGYCENLEFISLPSTLNFMGPYVFSFLDYSDIKLKTVIMLSATPPTFNEEPFDLEKATVKPTLYVPEGSKVAYQDAGYEDWFVILEGTVSIDNYKYNSVAIYPNPAREIINIEGAKVLNATIYDLSGKIILESVGSNSIYVNSIATGIYILHLQTENGLELVKLQKE